MTEEKKTFKLGNQAAGTLMMALQKCILEQKDIMGILRELDFEIIGSELTVMNPPTFLVKKPINE